MRIVHAVLAVMFMAFAFVQVNDPDPILWILIYGAMAAVSVMAMFKFYLKWLLWALAVAYAIYAVILFPGMMDWFNSPDRSLLFDDLAKMQYYYIEEAREFLGLIICLVAIAANLIQARGPARR